MTQAEPSADRHPLEVFFAPRSVAVIGASERAGSVGRTLMWNLVTSPFGGTVFPINSKRVNVLGINSWPSVASVPEKIDLAVVATPAAQVPGVIRECAAAGVRGAIIVSAGFRESGSEGLRLENEILETARAARMRIVGPNCLGVMCPVTGLNATFAGSMARKGDVAFLSQSGALQTAILDWSLQENFGFSAFVSMGSLLDVGWGDVIDYLDHDGRTKSVLIYMESVGDARAFLSAAREVTLRKPILVLKGGRTAQAAQAAASHTGALASSDEVLTAAFRRTGVLRVDTIADLFYMADTLSKQPRPNGRRLGIITNAGGPGVLAADALVAAGGEPATGSPVDLLGSADPEAYAKALEAAGADPKTDGILAVLAPQDRTEPTQTADRLKPYAHRYPGKPVLASWMGGAEVATGRRILSDAEIPTFNYPDTAARMFAYMWKYTYNLRALYETPALADEATDGHDRARELLQAVRADARKQLTELESKRLLATYGISTVETRLALSAEDAVREAEALGYPVAVKLNSRTVAHKSDVGGVQLDLRSAREVREAFEAIRGRLIELCRQGDFEGVTVQPMIRGGGYELIVGSRVDPQFGPVLLFGSGGVLVEVLKDRSVALPPLNTTLARRTIEQTRIHAALTGGAGHPAIDMAALEKLLVRFSQLVVEQRAIAEIEINPLLASPEHLIALDARIVLHGKEVADDRLPVPAIRPYPSQYSDTAELRNGGLVKIRPIRPEDEPRMVQFHGTLSDDSVFYRYAGMLKLDARVAHERLSRICFIDYDREMALVGERPAADGLPAIVAVARLTRLTGTREAEFALLVSDAVQGQGLGHVLLRRLFDVGRDWGIDRIVAEILHGNTPMRRVCTDLGFSFEGETRAFKDVR